MSGKTSGLKEVIPTSGLLFGEQSLFPVLCKPRLMPLKSVTLEKLERMQKEAQEKMWEMEKAEVSFFTFFNRSSRPKLWRSEAEGILRVYKTARPSKRLQISCFWCYGRLRMLSFIAPAKRVASVLMVCTAVVS